MARKSWLLSAALAVTQLFPSVSAAQPNSTTVDYLVVSPDYACTRITPGGTPQWTAQFTAIGWSAGPNAVLQDQGGDDFSLGAVPVEWATPESIYDAHSGLFALTESPNGNYGNQWNVRAQVAQSFDLSAAGSASLELWHHYELENNFDFGYIEVNSGSGWTAVRTYDGTLGSIADFHFVSVDLAPYLGQTIDVRFRVSTDGSVTRDGWVIDDVLLRIDAASVFADDMESGLGNWSISSQWGLTLPGGVNQLGSIDENGLFTAGGQTGSTFVRAIYDGSIEATAAVDVYPPDWVP